MSKGKREDETDDKFIQKFTQYNTTHYQAKFDKTAELMRSLENSLNPYSGLLTRAGMALSVLEDLIKVESAIGPGRGSAIRLLVLQETDKVASALQEAIHQIMLGQGLAQAEEPAPESKATTDSKKPAKPTQNDGKIQKGSKLWSVHKQTLDLLETAFVELEDPPDTVSLILSQLYGPRWEERVAFIHGESEKSLGSQEGRALLLRILAREGEYVARILDGDTPPGTRVSKQLINLAGHIGAIHKNTPALIRATLAKWGGCPID